MLGVLILRNNIFWELVFVTFSGTVVCFSFLFYPSLESGQFWTDPENINAVSEQPIFENRKQLQHFLSFVNFYRRFIKNYSQKHYPSPRAFTWSPEANTAFYKLKELFTSAAIVSHPDPENQFILDVDTSDSEMVVVLSQ